MDLPSEVQTSHRITIALLDEILEDFGLDRKHGLSSIKLIGPLPSITETKSDDINMSLIGAIPSLANAIVATQIFEARGGVPQSIEVDLRRAHNYLDPDIGMTPTLNDQEITLDVVAGNPFISGIYETADGCHVVPSAVYVDLVYRWSTFLKCAVNSEDVARAIKGWTSRGKRIRNTLSNPQLKVQKISRVRPKLQAYRSPSSSLQNHGASTDQGKHLSNLPIVPIRKIGTSPSSSLPDHPSRPLEGIKVLCLTHAIAGPSAGRTLAEHGASVLQIMYTHGYEHPFVYTYANLGCASSRLNLNRDSDRSHMWRLVREAHVWIDSYRGGALAKFGFTDEKLHDINPKLIISHVRLYGTTGPWSEKAGFDMQGSASSGMMALCGQGPRNPAWPPGQVINDYTTGYYGALAIQAAILRQMKEGGGYVLSPSLAGTAMSIVKYFRTSRFPELAHLQGGKLPPQELTMTTGLGVLKTLQPLPVLTGTPLQYSKSLSAMGSDLPLFPGGTMTYDTAAVQPSKKEDVLRDFKRANEKKTRELKDISARWTLA